MPLTNTDYQVYPTHKALLKVVGKDAASFLQGQLSCDVLQVNPEQSYLAICANIKGRVVASMRCLFFDEAYYLLLPDDMLVIAQQHLKKYALFSKVDISVCDDLFVYGVVGGDSPPARGMTKVIKLKSSFNRYEVISNQPIFENEIKAPSDQSWQLFDIKDGLPNILAATTEQFLPHRLNYHLIDGINFEKGCYLGQEIIARMHYRGKLKHHLYHIVVKTTQKIAPGTELQAKSTGHIINVVSTDTDQYHCLAVLNVEDAINSTISIAGQDAAMEIIALPYEF